MESGDEARGDAIAQRRHLGAPRDAPPRHIGRARIADLDELGLAADRLADDRPAGRDEARVANGELGHVALGDHAHAPGDDVHDGVMRPTGGALGRGQPHAIELEVARPGDGAVACAGRDHADAAAGCVPEHATLDVGGRGRRVLDLDRGGPHAAVIRCRARRASDRTRHASDRRLSTRCPRGCARACSAWHACTRRAPRS